MGGRGIGTGLAGVQPNVKAENAHSTFHALVLGVLGIKGFFGAPGEGNFETHGRAAENLNGLDKVFGLAWSTGPEVGVGAFGVADIPVSGMLVCMP